MIRWIFIGLGAIILLCAIAIAVLERSNRIEAIVPPSQIEEGEITITGTMVCLPHRNTSGPVTMECAFGLKGEDGNFYGLQNLNQEDIVTGALSPDMGVVVTGMVTRASGDELYNIVGTIAVTAIARTTSR